MGASTKTSRPILLEPNLSRRIVRFEKRGASLGLAVSNAPELISEVERGFSFDVLRRLSSYMGLNVTVLASVIDLPERTLARRRSSGKFAPEESERLLRISNIFEKAVALFEGDVVVAVKWLTTPKKALNHLPPLLYSRTEVGAREVENLIGRLEHGVFS
jgi:putative toxin-antitoxin system antitoxin component (TIGR02293 family)